MYNAFVSSVHVTKNVHSSLPQASSEAPGSKGTTRLHMDMADAVNLMVYACNKPDGSPGEAVWDIFRAEDSEKIREFLRARGKSTSDTPYNITDTIHSQQFYIDSAMRQQLHDEFGVKSWRIYQKPGEAVFIPAGCAHQVCNLADCIKIAIDFVSAEHVERCDVLTREFRDQNQTTTWKEDVLQLKTMLWYAWLASADKEEPLLIHATTA